MTDSNTGYLTGDIYSLLRLDQEDTGPGGFPYGRRLIRNVFSVQNVEQTNRL